MRFQEKKLELQSSIFHLQDQITYKRRHMASLERLGRNELHIRLAMEYGSQTSSPAASRSTSLGSIASYSTASTGQNSCRGATYHYCPTDARMDELRLELSTLQYLLAKRSKKLVQLCTQEQQEQQQRHQRYCADDEINFVF